MIGFLPYWRASALLRGTAHLTDASIDLPAAIDPYLVVLAGPSLGRFGVEFPSRTGPIGASGMESGVRLGGGIGANFVDERGWMLGAELRYLGTLVTEQIRDVSVLDSDGNEYTYARSAWDKPPRGFSWVLSAGRRF